MDVTAFEQAWREYVARHSGVTDINGHPFIMFAPTRDAFAAGFAAGSSALLAYSSLEAKLSLAIGLLRKQAKNG